MPEEGRWAGRNAGKDLVRHDIWRRLEEEGVAVGPAWSMIPNFVGADVAAWRLAQTRAWKDAKTVKTNPDHPQIPIRILEALPGKRHQQQQQHDQGRNQPEKLQLLANARPFFHGFFHGVTSKASRRESMS